MQLASFDLHDWCKLLFQLFLLYSFFLIRKIKIFKRVLQVSYADEDGKKQDTATIQFPATNARNAML